MHIPEPASLQLVAGTFRARYHFILATLTSTLEEELGATEEEAQKHVVEAFAMAKGVMMQLWANHNEVRTAASAEEYLEVLVKSVWRCCCGYTVFVFPPPYHANLFLFQSTFIWTNP